MHLRSFEHTTYPQA